MKPLIGSSFRLFELMILVAIFGILAAMRPPTASAAYFKLLNPLDEVKTGLFLKAGSVESGGDFGFMTTLIKHESADGFLFIPGVSWSLLDLGAFQDAQGINLVGGPSVDLSEPVKLGLRRGFGLLGRTPGAIAAVLAPTPPGGKSCGLSFGPGWGIAPNWLHGEKSKGYLLVHAGITAKWGGGTP